MKSLIMSQMVLFITFSFVFISLYKDTNTSYIPLKIDGGLLFLERRESEVIDTKWTWGRSHVRITKNIDKRRQYLAARHFEVWDDTREDVSSDRGIFKRLVSRDWDFGEENRPS